MLSAINWINRGLSSDRFDSTFGANAAVARSVVDAAIESWQRVLTHFNQPGGGNTINVNIAMESSGTGFGASATVTSHTGGYPTAGTIRLGRGNDVNGDGLGDGEGYFLDPTPFDHSEFAGNIVHAFSGDAQFGSPASGKPDLFTLVAHELTHVLGIVALASLKLHNPLAGTVVDTGIIDDSEGGGIGRYFVFDGPSVTHLMTSNNGGPTGSDAGRIVHTAGPKVGLNQPVTFTSAYRGELELVGTQDIVNPLYEFGRRYLPTDYLALLFQDAYGYSITLPQTFGTFYAMLNETTGELFVRGRTGAASSDDVFHIHRNGDNIVVSVDLGNDAPGSGPNGDSSNLPAYVTEFPLASVSVITVRSFDGNDTLTVDFSGGDPLPSGGLVFEGGFGNSDTLIVDLAGVFESTQSGTPNGSVHFPDINKTIIYNSVEFVTAINAAAGDMSSLVVAPVEIDEGQSVLLDLSFNAGTGGHQVTIQWGDGGTNVIPLSPGTTQLTGVSHMYLDDLPSGSSPALYTIAVTVVDENNATVFSDSEVVTVHNVPPVITSLSLSPSTVVVGGQALLQGTFFDPGVLDTFKLDLDLDGNGQYEVQGLTVFGGTFSLDLTFNQPAGTHPINVRLRDDDGGSDTASVTVTIVPQSSDVTAVWLFYNNSAFDGNGVMVSTADFAAIAPDKTPLEFGGTAAFEHISGYSRGINGIFIDVAALPNDGAALTAADFVFSVGNDNFPDAWSPAPAPTAFGVFPNQGAGGADRVYFTFADGAVLNTWLRMTVKAGAGTGLAAARDYFFGSAAGETGAGFTPNLIGVDAADLQSIAQDLTPLAEFGTVPITNPNDHNRDRAVNAFDLQVTGANLSPSRIARITPHPGTPAMASAALETLLVSQPLSQTIYYAAPAAQRAPMPQAARAAALALLAEREWELTPRRSPAFGFAPPVLEFDPQIIGKITCNGLS